MNDNIYTLAYAAMVCFVCSVLLSVFAMGLKGPQERAAQLDLNKKILKVFGLNPLEMTNAQVDENFNKFIKERVIDLSGNLHSELSFASLKDKQKCKVLFSDRPNNAKDCKLSLYEKVVDGKTEAVAIPIVGKGLWSTLYGYLALKPDANTVVGITFYKHGETPGLGAEIEAEWFQKNYVGKKVRNEAGEIVGITVAKGKAADSGSPIEHTVDGISGATITSNGVSHLVGDCLSVYEPYLSKLRSGGNS